MFNKNTGTDKKLVWNKHKKIRATKKGPLKQSQALSPNAIDFQILVHSAVLF
jgi:hypothetical protein